MTFNILTKVIATIVAAILLGIAAFFGADFTQYGDTISGILAALVVLAAAFVPKLKLVADGGSAEGTLEVVEEVAETVETVAQKLADAKKAKKTGATTPAS